jgi:hypothetical protein
MLANISFNNKSFLIRFIEYAAITLVDQNIGPERKATVIYLIGYLHSKILYNDYLKQQIGKFVGDYLIPFLKANDLIILSNTCEVLAIFLEKITLDQQVMVPVVEALYNCLLNKSLVVRFNAIMAFTALLSHEKAVVLVKPHFNNILTIYIKILDELDHEKLLTSLKTMVSKFELEISQMGDKLI